MRVRRVLVISCAALLVQAAPAGADEVAPSATVQPDAAPSAQPSPTTTPASAAAPEAPPAPAATAVPEATPEATSAPIPMATPEATPVAQTTPAPTPTAAVEATPAAQVTPVPNVMAAMADAATAASQSTPSRTKTIAAVAQATPTPTPAPSPPSDCATPVEIMETGEPTPSVDGVCRVSAAACSILGTDGDDVLTGSPFDEIMCGFGGNDRIDGGDGDDVLLGGEGDDTLVGGEGDDCMVGGPGNDWADNTGGRGRPPNPLAADEPKNAKDVNGDLPEFPETERSEARTLPPPSLGDSYAEGVTFDGEGRCTGLSGFSISAWAGPQPVPRSRGLSVAPRASAPTGAAPATLAAASVGSGGVRLGLPDGRLAVRDDKVRVRVSCSADVTGELVLLAGRRRIAHKRFTCTAPEKTVRVRLNDAGRTLMVRNDRVQARVLVLAAGSAIARQVLLVSPNS
jgi:hypothetical protein